MPTLEEQVTEAFRAEESENRQALTRGDVPRNYEAITCQWLTEILCSEAPGAQVVSFRVGDIDNGSSNRARIFLEYSHAGEEAGLPGSVFCKSATTLRNRVLLSGSAAAEGEAKFFSKVRHRLDIQAPEAWYAAFNPRTYGYMVVMKDLGGQADFCTPASTVDWPRAASMVNTLAKLHSRFYQSPELGSATLPFKTWPVWWADNLVATPTYGDACDTGFGAAQSVIPERLFKRRNEIWPATNKSVEMHNRLPHTLVHNDVHLGNWYIASSGEMGLGDWHLTGIGHWSRDFVYATTTALTVEDRRRWHEDLLRLYLERMAEYGAPEIRFDEAWLAIRQQLPSALSFWTITLRPAEGMPEMQPEATSFEFVKRLATALDDYEGLDSYG